MTNHERIKMAFGGIKAPEGISDRILKRTESCEPINKRNSHYMRRFSLAAVAVILALSFATVALAVSGIIDLGAIYNSFFNNPLAENKIEIERTVVENGLEVTFVSAFAGDGMAYAMIEIKDLEGERLSDSLRVLSESFSGIVRTNSVVFDETENKTTLVLNLMGRDIGVDNEIDFCIDAILSGFEYIENRALDIDISVYAINNETVTSEEWIEAAGGSVIHPDGSIDQGSLTINGELPDIAPLRMGDMDIVIDGVDWAVLSNAGVVDDRLHLQFKPTELYNMNYNCGYFNLMDGKANVVPLHYSIHLGGYCEMVFDISSGIDLRDLKLAVSGERFDNIVPGHWEMSFAPIRDMPSQSMIGYPEDTSFISKMKITSSPMFTSVFWYTNNADPAENGFSEHTPQEIDILNAYLEGFTPYFKSFGEPYLTLNDGATISLELRGAGYGYFEGSADYVNPYFDIEKLHSITIFGQEYKFNAP